MALAIFDLDNTLLGGDSDHLWGAFLVEQGLVDGEFYQRENDRYYQKYLDGDLDIYEFLSFSLKPLSEIEPVTLKALHRRFMAEKIEPIILPAGEALIRKHREAGDTLIIITATNAFVTAPIAERLGIEHLLATEPEMVDGRYTGGVSGIPSYREGKIQRLEQWAKAHGIDLQGSAFYSDSHNDIPLLERVDRPVAVDPDDNLRHYATERGWEVISLRG